MIGEPVDVFWYQNDKFDELSEVVLNEEGINTLVNGVNKSLRGLKFFGVSEDDEVEKRSSISTRPI